MDDDKAHRFLKASSEAARETIALWGSGAIGPVLVTRFFSKDPWITAAELAKQLHLSTAQTRRRLDELYAEGKVCMVLLDRQKHYSAHREYAEATLAIIAAPTIAFCNED